MATNMMHANLPMKVQVRSHAANVGGFLWHFLQMVLAMEIGMMVYHLLLRPLLAQTPYADLTAAYPLIGYWMMVTFMILGMLALMLYRKSTGRYCLEMTLAMLMPIAMLTVLVLCSLIPSHTLYGAGDPLMFLAMAAFMLYRPHEDAHVVHEHTGHQHADPSEAETTQHTVHDAHN